MIAPGTICVIRNTPEVCADARGRFCTMVGHADPLIARLFSMDCCIEIASLPCPAGPGTWWYISSRNLIPLNQGSEDPPQAEIDAEHGVRT